MNRVMADSFDLLSAMPSNCVDAVVTDPPYDLSAARQLFLHEQFLRIARGDVLVFCSPNNLWPVRPDQWLFWVKPTSTKNFSRRYGLFVEMIAVFKRSNVWDPGYWANASGVYHDVLEGQRVHSHQKPVSLMERLVRNHTEPGARVLDPFCGSGSTLRACARSGRVGIGVDVEV